MIANRKLRHRISCRAGACALLLVAALACKTGTTPREGADEARALFEAGRFEEVVQTLDAEEEAVGPGAPDELMLRGRSLFELRRYPEAIDALTRLIEMDPENAEAHRWRGRAWGRLALGETTLNRYPAGGRAGADLERSVELDPNDFASQQILIEFYARAPHLVHGGREKALERIEVLEGLDPVEACVARARLHELEGNPAAAANELERALALRNDEARLHRLLGAMLQEQGKHRRALHEFERALEIDPGDRSCVYFLAVHEVRTGGDLERARTMLTDYLAMPPRSTDVSPDRAFYYLGVVHEAQGSPMKARAAYRQALELNSEHDDARAAWKRLE